MGSFNEDKRNFINDPILTKISKKYNKSVAQVVLRWNIQSGVIVILKSVHEESIKQNIDIFNFKLTDDDMKNITSMDISYSEIVNHYDTMIQNGLKNFIHLKSNKLKNLICYTSI